MRQYGVVSEERVPLGLARGRVRLDQLSERWASAYVELERRLQEALNGLDVRIEHVGSTAVPYLPAKPILDVDCGTGA